MFVELYAVPDTLLGSFLEFPNTVVSDSADYFEEREGDGILVGWESLLEIG